jgi:formylglycine-generating enzyme required for sulfatase activity
MPELSASSGIDLLGPARLDERIRSMRGLPVAAVDTEARPDGSVRMNRQIRRTVADGMRRIPGGESLMGSDHHYPEEAPSHRVRVAPFSMDETTVTNRQFAAFVAETGYLTAPP